MSDLKMSEIMSMQRELQEKYKGKWMPLTPDNGRSSLLWLIEEMGEAIAIIKKRGEKAIMNDSEVRKAFVEEMVDVIMYYTDALACYGITSEEFSEVFMKKHSKNMGRDFVAEHKEFLQTGKLIK
ncbi:hypothetical protein SDC9_201870 [bioreactor metagenome]|uniref:NTP pyrophosphohydrolase MazG putative catalytic core domain-containing protein n=1 Tax=bioreactor metagenome TaxID=1076179 RepID=A0A645ITH8_9ZZZZ